MSTIVGAQQHGPGEAAHLVLLAGVVVAALIAIGVSRWRKRRDTAVAAEEHSTSPEEEA
jgi:hypothetical protein